MSRITQHNPAAGKRLSALRGVVWDLDNTLYRFNSLVIHAFDLAFARVAVESGAPLTVEEASALARQSYIEHGFGGRVFMDRYGMDRATLHHRYHGYVDEKVIEGCDETRALFEKSDGLDHILLTHGSRSWADRVLQHIGLRDYFPDDRILALEDYGFRQKNEAPAAFEAALDRLGMDAASTLMVEDTQPNLKIPHGMGMMTAFLDYGAKPAHTPSFIDLSCHDTTDLLRWLGSVQRDGARVPHAAEA